MNELWILDPSEEQYEFCRWVIGEYDQISNEYWYKAFMKENGCIEYYKYFSAQEGRIADNLHICSLKQFINELIELRKKGKELFGDDWDE